MINLRPVFFVNGVLLLIIGLLMIIPAMVDFFTNDQINAMSFIFSSLITLFISISLIIGQKSEMKNISIKQAFLLTTTAWISLTIFSALPFIFGSQFLSFTDAFFEAMSGLTTTGATIMNKLEEQSYGILLWRAILQWIGGIGIIVLALAVLPMLKIGGMQLFRSESSEKSNKIFPRITQFSGAIGLVYISLTAICAVFLWLFGMNVFDAIYHAMTTLSTGGFSTHDSSIAYYQNNFIECILTIFMLLSGIPFILYFQCIRGNSKALFHDTQVKWYIGIIAVNIAILASWLVINSQYDYWYIIKIVSFNIVSVITSTGFVSADYYQWGSLSIIIFFFISVVGGCTGSSTGGIKIFRFQMLFETARSQIYQLIHPHAIYKAHFNGQPVSENISSAVMGFFILFAFLFSIITVLLSLTGMDYISSMSISASALGNVGPALGKDFGPTSNLSQVTDFGKWVISFAMLIGRLEIFTVLILFSPKFWRG